MTYLKAWSVAARTNGPVVERSASGVGQGRFLPFCNTTSSNLLKTKFQPSPPLFLFFVQC